MRWLTLFSIILFPLIALAGVDGSGFDGMPLGPYAGTATVNPPGAAGVEVVPDSPGFMGASNLGNGTGNMLRIDTVNHPGPITVTFTFNCDIQPEEYCRIKYDYAGAAWNLGAGFGVYVDDPTLTNPDDLWEPPVGLPPTTVGPGENTEGAGDCDGLAHSITFVVYPGTILHLDNMVTECLEDVISDHAHSWSTLKALYR